MSLLVVGSVALDSVETPTDRRDNVLGGAAVFFSYAASYFTKVNLVGVVGDDWPTEHTKLLQKRGIDTAGLQVVPGGKTFRWRGKYQPNMNDRETLEVHLNVFGDFNPVVPEPFRACKFLFLANGSPATQASVLDQMQAPRFCVADTMDLWIERERQGLLALLRRIDGLIVNDSEVKQLTGKTNLIQAGRACLALGPKLVIVKKGEHGSFVFSNFFHYALPAYPTETVVDPTGAGDSFAGGFMGYLANCNSISLWNMKRAVAYGTCAASLNVEGFGVQRLAEAKLETLERRYQELQQFVSAS